ncbi:type III secretion system outer membrane ring subunit SctC [Pleionea sp. CnH1-48]|uniref:type III secretion system outer membrane ring subunit SctC n=1 Tax=Pleionea sp. CnH1-48 TaxID=2954494 RepID=UPI0020980BC1|nr:type III secretion system outer membrane ring subunit SctC [Pleionea sp. CnH1-48]MCO7227019.1 type III secretion system outer membrane ring subunit SctC [Pleionea sp. CnH1-48]
MYKRIYSVCIGLCLIAAVFSNIAEAKLPKWSKKPFGYVANGESISKILNDFSVSYGIPAIVSEGLTQQINGKFSGNTAEEFLGQLSKITSFLWYYDGHVFYFYTPEEITSEILRLKYLDADALYKLLRKLPLWDERYRWTSLSVEEKRVILISGPPRFVELVSEIASLFDQKVLKEKEETFAIRVFKLKYAPAEDRKVTIRGEESIIPGVASMISQMVEGGYQQLGVSKDEPKRASTTIEGLRGKGLSKFSSKSQENQEEDESNNKPTKANAKKVRGEAPTQQTFIAADTRLNAVLIGDMESRMPMYQKLIEELDQPVSQVEINVSIISISADNLQDLGIDWQRRGSDGIINFGDINTSAATGTNGTIAPDVLLSPTDGGISIVNDHATDLSTILAEGRHYFLARLRLMEQQGNAKITGQPSLLTLDNTEATLDNSQTFYIRVAGQEEVDLFPVSVGTILQVTPHVFEENGKSKVQMDIQIVDGQQSTTQQVDSIPVISTTTITTQSIVGAKESLLIGGYTFESETETETHVPVLHKIPILGNLFKNNKKTKARSVRLFLITPRVLAPEKSHGKTVPQVELLNSDRVYEQITNPTESDDSDN